MFFPENVGFARVYNFHSISPVAGRRATPARDAHPRLKIRARAAAVTLRQRTAVHHEGRARGE